MKQVIKVMKRRVLEAPFDPAQYRWTIDEQHRLAWLQRLGLRLLERVGLHCENVWNQIVEHHEIHTDDLLEQIIEQRHMVEHIYRHEPVDVFMGPDDEIDLLEVLSIHARYEFGGPQGRKVCGLNIKIVPWMRGILVL